MPDAIDLIRFEKNLLQIGFFGAHERRGKQAVSSRRIEQWVNRDGKKIKVSAEFRSSDALGLPSTSDRDKYMAFMKLAMETKLRNGVITNPICFSGYSLLNALGQCDSGENYEALNSWGMRMADTTITSEQVIYSSLRKRYMNKTVHVFRSFTRLGASNLDGTNKTDMFEVELEDWLLENLNESFVVPEDFTMYRKLVRPTAKGIFVYLYLWFFASQGKEVEKDYAELCALLNVRAYEHVSKIRETMGLSLTDLVEIGYLKSWDIKPMSSKAGYKLVLTPGRALKEVLTLTQRKQLAFAAAYVEPLPLSDAREQARTQLVEHGVSPAKAAELARKLDVQALLDRIEYVSSQVACDRKGNIKNPAGYLIRFAEDEQPIPSTFLSSRQRRVEERRRQEADVEHPVETVETLAEMQLQEEYERWCRTETDEHIRSTFPEVMLARRMREISSRVRKDGVAAASLDRMRPEARRAELMRVLRGEVRKELMLPTLAEWVEANPQG
ncbi:MAG: replication initiator protein A, partial [Janthinobacterium lividum]